MKKTTVILAASLLGLILLAPFLIEPQTVEAQTVDGESHSSALTIISPSNTTYSSNLLLLNVTIHRQFKPTEYDSRIMYSLNGENNVTVPSTETFFDMTTPDSIWSALASYTLISGTVFLQNLSEGYYFLTVFGVYERAKGISTKYPAVMQDTETVFFTINDGIAPSLTNLQIDNRTFSQNNLPLNISVDEQVSWMGYSLDGETNVTFTGNTTLNGLLYGSHSLVVYANDTVGNMGTTGSIDFTVAKPESFPVVPVAATVAVIAGAVAAGLLLLYCRKHRPDIGPKTQLWRSLCGTDCSPRRVICHLRDRWVIGDTL